MSRLRSLLVPLTIAWLSVHVLVITGNAIVVLTAGESMSDVVCTCVHGADHGSCPMHKSPARSSARCGMQSAADSLATALTSVLGPLVLPATADVALLDAPDPGLIGYRSPPPTDWLVPPDTPPPRI